MIPGFNHNIQRNGKIYHIQTEDSGLANPHIITLLYLDGTIVGKKKTSYADITRGDNLPGIVRQLMEEQHKAMLRDLIKGTFDNIAGLPPAAEAPAAPVVTPPVAAAPVAPRPAPKPAPVAAPAPVAPPKPAAQPTSGPTLQADDLGSLFGGGGAEDGDKSLDEIILSYLSDDKS